MPPVQGALDQIVQRFGTDQVAEVTGRSRRIVRKGDRLAVENRAGSANLAEAQAFMDDEKRILVFSDAGGTGRSYHADLGAKNRRLRVHYLLEAGWKADTAIQGLGRSNRTNQAQPPLFRPIATNVKAEKRFLSTIARRLDTLGAITKRPAPDRRPGPVPRRRQSRIRLWPGGAAPALCPALQRQGRGLLAAGLRGRDRPVADRRRRQPARGAAADHDLSQPAARADHRCCRTRCSRVFEDLLRAKIEGAIASGTYDLGVETLTAESLAVIGAPHDLHASGDRRRDAGVHRRPPRSQQAARARRGAGSWPPIRAPACWSTPVPAGPRCRCRRRA